MLRTRTFIHLLVGLALLLQGMTVSATSLPQPQNPPAMEMSAMEGMPCHMGADTATDTQKSCCDQSCHDMALCLASIAAITSMSLLVVPLMAIEAAPHPQAQSPTRATGSLLRPPISLRG